MLLFSILIAHPSSVISCSAQAQEAILLRMSTQYQILIPGEDSTASSLPSSSAFRPMMLAILEVDLQHVSDDI